ncbi:MAG: TonB family protein [Alphaproteobacteria bacterium]
MRAANKGGEGWVEISYVVDTNGNVQDPIVNDFVGHNDFKMAAIEALEKWQFSSAIKDGQPTEQCHQNIRFEFFMGKQNGASRKLIRRYKEANVLLEQNDLASAAEKK